MSNKTITIGNTSSIALEDYTSKEIYRDVSLMGESKIQESANSSKYKVGKLVNVNAIKNSLHQIFSWIPGERILLPEFGSNLRKLLYEGITSYNTEQIVAEIRHCISEWEPRIALQKVVNVSNDSDTEDNTVHIEVLYTIPGLTDEKVYSEVVEFQKR